MHILIGILLGVILLWAWLIGHWFARVLVFLLLACVGFVAGAAVENASSATTPANVIIVGLIGAALAWPVAGLPVYYWRHRIRQLVEYHGGD